MKQVISPSEAISPGTLQAVALSIITAIVVGALGWFAGILSMRFHRRHRRMPKESVIEAGPELMATRRPR